MVDNTGLSVDVEGPLRAKVGEIVDAGVLDPSPYGISVSTGVVWSEETEGVEALDEVQTPPTALAHSLYLAYRPKYHEIELDVPYWFAQQIPVELGETLEIRGCAEGDWFLSLESGFQGVEALDARVVNPRPSARVTLANTHELEPVRLEYVLEPN